jgi:uncharacterized membrane protein YgdD (TMEM256/DUF423 family)
MDRAFFAAGSVFAALAVGLGAFGAHALKSRLPPDLLAVYDTAVRWHLAHALALLAVAWACARWPGVTAITAGGWLLAAGIAVFSGSLYLLALTGARTWGAVTPIGGVAWIVGWACVAWGVWRAPAV